MSRTVLTNFRADDFKASKSSDRKTGTQKREAGDKSAAQINSRAEDGGVPEGTTEEILTWVGPSKERAQQALDAENASDKPRVTLIEPLEKALFDPEAVPDGTVAEVLEWAGDDEDRKARALAAELEREHPRAGVTKALEPSEDEDSE